MLYPVKRGFRANCCFQALSSPSVRCKPARSPSTSARCCAWVTLACVKDLTDRQSPTVTKPNHSERSKSKFVVVVVVVVVVVELQECSFNALCAHKTCVTLMRNGMLLSKKLHKQLGEFAGQRSVKLFYVMEVPALPVA